MKLTHEDAMELVETANDILSAFDRLVSALMDAAMTEGTKEEIISRMIVEIKNRDNAPSVAAMTRLRMEREFYARNALRLQKQTEAVARHRARKMTGWVTQKHKPHIMDGAHIGSIAPENRVDQFTKAQPRASFLGRVAPSAGKLFTDPDTGRTAIHPVVEGDDIPAYALANTVEDYERLKALYDKEHGLIAEGLVAEPQEPLKPLFKVKESERAKDGPGTDTLEF